MLKLIQQKKLKLLATRTIKRIPESFQKNQGLTQVENKSMMLMKKKIILMHKVNLL